MTDEQVEIEQRTRVRRLLCAIYAWEGITISQAQAILGKYADADNLIPYMLNTQKSIMPVSGAAVATYQFTHVGLVGLYEALAPEARLKFGERMTEYQMMEFVRSEAKKTAGRKP